MEIPSLQGFLGFILTASEFGSHKWYHDYAQWNWSGRDDCELSQQCSIHSPELPRDFSKGPWHEPFWYKLICS
jgi:hypothetical protein